MGAGLHQLDELILGENARYHDEGDVKIEIPHQLQGALRVEVRQNTIA